MAYVPIRNNKQEITETNTFQTVIGRTVEFPGKPLLGNRLAYRLYALLITPSARKSPNLSHNCSPTRNFFEKEEGRGRKGRGKKKRKTIKKGVLVLFVL